MAHHPCTHLSPEPHTGERGEVWAVNTPPIVGEFRVLNKGKPRVKLADGSWKS